MENITFESAVKRIEEIVAILEQGSAPLDKSLELFEEGNRLIRQCAGMLDGAEQKLRMLTLDSGAETVPFEVKE